MKDAREAGRARGDDKSAHFRAAPTREGSWPTGTRSRSAAIAFHNSISSAVDFSPKYSVVLSAGDDPIPARTSRAQLAARS
eukprot:3856065-Pyramimonas_sp.AAC.1